MVCEHHFQVFVDKNLAVRGYQRVDYEMDGFIESILGEVSTENNFFTITATEDKKIAYCSRGSKAILTTVASPSTSDIQLNVYSEHVAAKVELILEEKENVIIEIPEIIKAISKTRSGKLPSGIFSTKIIMTGDYQVGKTSMVKRFTENLFEDDYQPTLGVDISQKSIKISDETKIDFVIWDISGQKSQISPYRKRFYEGVNSAFIVLDRTRPGNLKSVENWYNEIKNYVQTDISIILVGNKSDLLNKIVITEEDIKKISDQYGFHYILTSAKTGESVNDSFLYTAYRFLESA